MKRRDFLKLLGLAPAAALLPKVTLPEAPAALSKTGLRHIAVETVCGTMSPQVACALEAGAARLRAMEAEAAEHGLIFQPNGDVEIRGTFYLGGELYNPGQFGRRVGVVSNSISKWDGKTWAAFDAPIDPNAV